MKKFLSLVLALVMTMSLVTISAGAKDYADADKITYVEAVDVLSALGVLEGDANGFRPTDTLKRSEAAKIICALNLTPKTAATLSADAAPFADVAKSHWAAGYIAEGVDSGILAGVGGNKFDPDGQLIGYAYLKMLLVSLGYDAAIEGMTGANWSVNVAKLAKKAGLTDGNDDFVGSAAVTREEAALYALNTLQAKTVEYKTKGTSITINGVEIVSGASSAQYVTDEDGNYVPYKAENYSKLVDKNTFDAYGRPATKWTYKGSPVGTYADAAIVSFTEATKKDDVIDALEDAGYDEEDIAKGVTVADTKNGTLVEYFGKEVENEEDGSTTNVVYKVVSIETFITEVGTITKDKAKTEDDERAIAIGNYGKIVADDEVTTGVEVSNFDELFDELEKGDKVLVTLDTDGKIETVVIPETIEGKVTGVYDSYIKVDGEKIKLSAKNTGFASNKTEQTIWLDTYGYAIAGKLVEKEESDIVYLVKLYESKDKYGTPTNYAQIVTAEGEVVELTIDEEADLKGIVEGKLYTYTGSEDEATLVPADEDDYIAVKADLTSKIKIDSKYYADDVTFIYADGTGAKLSVTVKDEAAKFTRDEKKPETIYAILDSDGKYITTVIIAGEAQAEETEADELVFVKKTDSVGTELDDDDKSQPTYEIYINGEKETVIATGITKVGYYKYSVDGSTYKLTFKSAVTVESIAKDEYITLSNGKTDVTLSDDAEIYNLSDETISDLADLNEVMVDADNVYDDVVAYAVYDSDDEVVTCIYVI